MVLERSVEKVTNLEKEHEKQRMSTGIAVLSRRLQCNGPRIQFNGLPTVGDFQFKAITNFGRADAASRNLGAKQHGQIPQMS